MERARHPKKEVEEAIRYAQTQGWRIEVGGNHAWGRMYCPYNDVACRCGEFCITSIWSTPKNPGNHARQIKRIVDNCMRRRQERVMEYDFELKFKLPADAASTRERIERLGACGCDDAAVGIGQSGRMALSFTREASSAKRAFLSAVRDVKKAVPDAELLEAGPDFVSLSDIADAVDVSRQNMRKLMLAYSDSFPAPIHEGSAAFWHLAPVLRWLQERQGYGIERPLIDVAHMAMQINLAKAARQLEAPLRKELRGLVA